jgi:hypothetical protein
MLGRQPVAAGRRIEDDQPPGDHGGQPLAHVALREPGAFGDDGAARRRQAGHGIEEAAAVADRGHDGNGPVVQNAGEPFGEALRLGRIEGEHGRREV